MHPLELIRTDSCKNGTLIVNVKYGTSIQNYTSTQRKIIVLYTSVIGKREIKHLHQKRTDRGLSINFGSSSSTFF